MIAKGFYEFSGKVALVTGAGSGLGRTVAMFFADHGATVIVAEKEIHAGKDTEQLIKDRGGIAVSFQTDVTSEDDVKNVVAFAFDSYGRLDFANIITMPGLKERVPHSRNIQRTSGIRLWQ